MAFSLTSPSMRGRLRKRSGDQAEQIVELHWANLSRLGVAHLFKLPTPFKVLRSLGASEFRGCWTGPSPYDYCGYTARGQFVAVEVKRLSCEPTKSGWSAIRFDLDLLAEHQIKQLAAAHVAGARVFVVLVAMQVTTHRLFAIPWASIAYALFANRKSISESDLNVYEIKSGYLLEAELGAKL